MNERIKQLAKEAAREMNETGTYSEPKFQEKFAELIVKECDRYVAEQYDESEPWMQPGDLLKHFGVRK